MAWKVKLFIKKKGSYLMKLLGLCRPVIIVMILLPFVDSLVFRTAYYSESQANQFFDIHEDFRLVGHVIETLIADDFECGLRCIRNKKCQSYNYQSGGNHGNKTCDLNDQSLHSTPSDLVQAKGITYYGKERRGFHSSNPGRSCKDILPTEIPMRSGEYWIDPDNTGNPFKVYCDMLYGGGWLLVANFVIDESGPPPADWTAEPTYRGISNYNNKGMGISRNAMNELRKRLHFTQLRFHCRKRHNGRVISILTAANSFGEAVVQYFSGETDVEPTSCGSFFRFSNDNSRLAKNCTIWGYNKTTEQYFVGTWSGINSHEYVMYDHAFFIAGKSHWVVGKASGRWECDDYDPTNNNVTKKDFWRIYVR